MANVKISELPVATTVAVSSVVPVVSSGITKQITVANLIPTVSVKNYGAVGDGSTNDAAAFTSALTSGASKVVAPTGTYSLASGITVPAGVELLMDYGATLKPSVDMTYVVKVHAGGWFEGRIRTRDISFTGIAVNFDGDDNADAVPFRLHTKSGGVAVLEGGSGAGTGTAVKLHADGIANARVMGVDFDCRILGFENGYWLRQTSTDLTKFVNDNTLRAVCSDTLNAVKMESSHVNSYGVDRNFIKVEVQPFTTTTVPAATLCGQGSEWNITPWDWSTVVGTAPIAITIAAATRNAWLTTYTDRTYITNNSVDRTMRINNLNDYLTIGALRSVISDFVIKLAGTTTFEWENNTFLKMLTSTGTSRSVFGFNASDDLIIQGSNGAGDNIIMDAANATGSYAFRVNGSNAGFILSSKALQWQAPFYPSTASLATQTASSLYAGSGAPSDVHGSNGDFYFRSDGAAGTFIYHKAGGTWAAFA